MQMGRMSDTGLVLAMLALVAVFGVGIFGSVWLAGRTDALALDEALERQPAELVEDPDEFVTNVDFDEDGPVDCRPGPVEVVAVNVADGSVAWRRDQPPPGSGHHTALSVIEDGRGGHLALAVDEFVGERPPSILALDVSSGEPRWQRFIATDLLHPTLVGPDSMVVSTERTPLSSERVENVDFTRRFLLIDGSGQIQDHPSMIGGDGSTPVPEIRTDLSYVSDLHPQSPLLSDWPGVTPAIRALVQDDFGVRSIEAPDPISGETVFINNLPFDDEFDVVGSSSSPGEPVQVGEDRVLVVLGSSFGPNTRLAVFDRTDSSLLWTLDHTRAAALADDNIVYDERNDEPPDAESTRDLHLVSGDDPEGELWSTALSVNSDGGNGYLGTVDGSLVFAVDGETDGIAFLTIDSADDVPDLLEAAEGFGSGNSGRHHVDADVFAAATPSGVVVKPDGRDPLLVETDQSPTQVTKVGDVLLVVANHGNIFCD